MAQEFHLIGVIPDICSYDSLLAYDALHFSKSARNVRQEIQDEPRYDNITRIARELHVLNRADEEGSSPVLNRIERKGYVTYRGINTLYADRRRKLENGTTQ